MSELIDKHEQERRWRLAIGVDDDDSYQSAPRDARIAAALNALYGQENGDKKKQKGSLSRSAPRVAKWLGDIREFFPAPVVQIIQKDALDRMGLRQMLLEPELMSALEADVNLVADLISLRSAMPDRAKETARGIIRKVVDELMERLERKTAEALRGAIDKSKRTHRPRFSDIDWPRTIRANLRHYQREFETVVPERLVGFMRQQRRLVDLDEVVLCVDQSGSMATSVVYASIFAAVMASLPVISTKLVCFDTAILDLTGQLADPVDVLFGVQLGGGTDINQAVAYCASKIERPARSHFVLISDLYEGGNEKEMLQRVAALIQIGVNVIILLALSDCGHAAWSASTAAAIAEMGAPVFACTPGQFPDLMATALRRQDIAAWAASNDIKLVRAEIEV